MKASEGDFDTDHLDDDDEDDWGMDENEGPHHPRRLPQRPVHPQAVVHQAFPTTRSAPVEIEVCRKSVVGRHRETLSTLERLANYRRKTPMQCTTYSSSALTAMAMVGRRQRLGSSGNTKPNSAPTFLAENAWEETGNLGSRRPGLAAANGVGRTFAPQVHVKEQYFEP